MSSKPEAYQSFEKQAPKGQWTTGLYDCWDDPSHCCFTCWCPFITFGKIAEIIDGGTTSKNAACCIYYCLGAPPGMSWLYSATYRSKLRRLFSLPQEPYSDSFVHACCCVCSITQEYIELKNRGIDPSIGWEGNVEKWKREGVEPPIVPTMTR